ncbi:Sperm-associated antigen 6 [Gonapodya sp. JEL0774]|nr:Sperm-associated antigen 6 [Gonapodya sp. JEL0774]
MRPATPPNADLSADHTVGATAVTSATSDLPNKAHRALKAVLAKTTHLSYIDPLLGPSSPRSVLKHVVVQLAKVLPNDVAARKEFVSGGGLGRLEMVKARLAEEDGKEKWEGGKLAEAVRIVEECYPEEIVRYYSPDYSKTLLDRIEEYGRSQTTAAAPGVPTPSPAPPPPADMVRAGSFIADLPTSITTPGSASLAKPAAPSKRASQAMLNTAGGGGGELEGMKKDEGSLRQSGSRMSVGKGQEQ